MRARTWLLAVIPAGLALGLMLGWVTAGGQATPYPHFKASPQGWLPSCPPGTALIRHYPPPDCFWGTAPLNQKPTQGDMECVPPAQASQLPACPKE